jgi:GT2 family glycosyltransferase
MREAGNGAEVVAIILNYNRAGDTIDCTQSLKRCSYAPLKIVILDNGSTDDSGDKLRRSLPGVDVRISKENLGFAGGNNLVLRSVLQGTAEYVLLLNNDTLVEPDFLTPLVDALARNPKAAAAGGTICCYPEKGRLWYAGGRFIPWRASSFSDLAGAEYRNLPSLDERNVTFITGCMILMRTEALKRAGLFDERFFMYAEDAELSVRLNSLSYELLYVPESRIYHKGGERDGSPFALYYSVRNRLLFIRVAITGWMRPIAACYLLMTTLIKMCYWRIFRPDLFRAAVMGAQDYFRNVLYAGRGLSLRDPVQK